MFFSWSCGRFLIYTRVMRMARNPKGSSTWDQHSESGSGTQILWDSVIILDRDSLLGQKQWSSGLVGVGGSGWVPSPASSPNHIISVFISEDTEMFWSLGISPGAPGVSPGTELQLMEQWGERAMWQGWIWAEAQRSKAAKAWLPQHCQTLLTFLTQPLIHKVRLKKKPP